MNNLNLKPAMRYQLDYLKNAFLIALGILFVASIVISVFISFRVLGENSTLMGIDGVFVIMIFIIGICGIREDLRFFIQHGMGRLTTYFSTLFASLICSAALGLIITAFTAFSSTLQIIRIESVFSWILLQSNSVPSLISLWILSTFTLFFANQLGILISLIYYRLNKIQCIVFSVLAGASIIFIPRLTLTRRSNMGAEAFDSMWHNFFHTPATLILTFAIVGILAAIGSFLLLRRAQIT